MLYPVNGSGIQGAVAAKLYEMPDTENFTMADRKMVIESQLLISLTRQDVQALMLDLPRQRAADRAELNASSEKLEVRVRILENFRWWLLGAVAFVSPIMAALTSWLFSKGHP